jgi:hypothetical protein
MQAQLIGSELQAGRLPAPFLAVMQALQMQRADTSALLKLSDSEWRELLPMLDRARLTLPLAQRGYAGLPRWVDERLDSNLADTAKHWKLVQAAYREVAATLDAVGVEYVVLKGFTQAPEFVSRPELRRQGDIDLYVPRQQIPSAVAALQGTGYASCHPEKDYQDADHVPALVRFGAWKWNGNIYDPDVPPVIEIHFCLWNDSVYSVAVPETEKFWDRRRSGRLEEMIFPTLDLVDHVGYLALHILRSIFVGRESPVHHVRELATFLHNRADDALFWGEWSMLHSRRLRSMEAIAFSLAHAWFSCDLPAAAKAQIDSLSPRVQAWIETCGSVPLENTFRRTRDGKSLQFLLAETHEARWKIARTALSPGVISGPAKVATYGIHPTTPAEPNLILSYLKYPAYILSRIWLNGTAVLRFLARACLLYLPRVRMRRIGLKISGV